jgi:hypothetical protein
MNCYYAEEEEKKKENVFFFSSSSSHPSEYFVDRERKNNRTEGNVAILKRMLLEKIKVT